MRTAFLALCLVYSDAINASEKVSDVWFTRRAAVKNDCGMWPNLPSTFNEPIIWLLKSANRSVRVWEWERLKECCQECVWKKQKQICNQKKTKQTHDIWNQTGLIQRPLLEITKPINHDRSRLLFASSKLKDTPSQLDISTKIGYTFQGQMPQTTLRCTLYIRGGIESMGCGIMEQVKRFQTSGINTSWPFVWHLLVALLGVYSW